MMRVSETYRAIWRDSNHRKEHKAEIAGVTYGANVIAAPPVVSKPLLEGGNTMAGHCISGQLTLSVIPQGTIPRMAEIRLYTRLAGEVEGVEQVSEWLPKGVFYIDTRATDRASGVVTIRAYDAMLKAEQLFLTETTEDDWPKPMDEVVAEIASRMGLTLDSRTAVSHAMTVGFPLEYTMRELLGYIAVAHAGNWIITDTGQLRLVKLTDTPAETYYLVSEEGDAILFGDTRIMI